MAVVVVLRIEAEIGMEVIGEVTAEETADLGGKARAPGMEKEAIEAIEADTEVTGAVMAMTGVGTVGTAAVTETEVGTGIAVGTEETVADMGRETTGGVMRMVVAMVEGTSVEIDATGVQRGCAEKT
jgi:hypothetical protein